MLTCQELTELITEYLEGRMSFWRRAQVHMHLGMCRHCRAYLRQMKATVRTLGRVPHEEPVPPDLKAELLRRLRDMAPPDHQK
jgi:predicted anti-sigma-YlaC factor YlaD